jgi:hypothetical protein
LSSFTTPSATTKYQAHRRDGGNRDHLGALEEIETGEERSSLVAHHCRQAELLYHDAIDGQQDHDQDLGVELGIGQEMRS